MSVRGKEVDYGPASLRVGEEWKPSDPTSRPPDPDPADVMRFREVAAVRSPATAQAYDDRRTGTPFELMDARSAFAGHATTPELGEVVERLWVGTGTTREVRIQLHREVLPDSWLVMFEFAGRLQVQFTVACARTHRWMAGTLGDLAKELGGRLERPLRVTLKDGCTGAGDDVHFDWPEDAPP